MLIALVPLLVAVVGILIYVLATNAKLVEIGRCLMWSGIFVTVLSVIHKTATLF